MRVGPSSVAGAVGGGPVAPAVTPNWLAGNPGADHATVARLLVEAGSVPDPEWQDVPAWLEAAVRGG